MNTAIAEYDADNGGRSGDPHQCFNGVDGLQPSRQRRSASQMATYAGDEPGQDGVQVVWRRGNNRPGSSEDASDQATLTRLFAQAADHVPQ